MRSPTLKRQAIQAALNAKTKPPGSLGRMEDLTAQIAMIQSTLNPYVDRQRVVVFAASHGIAANGVSAYPTSVTAQMVRNFISGGATICVLCRSLGVDLRIIDVGVDDTDCDLGAETQSFRRTPVRKDGTSSFLNEAAMTTAECQQAMQVGADEVHQAIADGIQILSIGAMGSAQYHLSQRTQCSHHWAHRSLDYVREDADSKSKPLAIRLGRAGLTWATITGIAPLLALAWFFQSPLLLTAVPLTLAARQFLIERFQVRLGGYTGDCLGAIQQISEVLCHLVFIAVERNPP